MKKFKQQHMNVEVTKLKTKIETTRKRKTESYVRMFNGSWKVQA